VVSPALAGYAPLVAGYSGKCTIDWNRPGDTTAYAADDAIADSTSAPTDFACTGLVDAAGKMGVITAVHVTSSNAAATPLQMEVFMYDASVDSPNDNASFAISDANAEKLQCRVALVLSQKDPSNTSAFNDAVGCPFKTNATTGLYFRFKANAAFTPVSAENLHVEIYSLQTN
jgi:hypothetical protein